MNVIPIFGLALILMNAHALADTPTRYVGQYHGGQYTAPEYASSITVIQGGYVVPSPYTVQQPVLSAEAQLAQIDESLKFHQASGQREYLMTKRRALEAQVKQNQNSYPRPQYYPQPRYPSYLTPRAQVNIYVTPQQQSTQYSSERVYLPYGGTYEKTEYRQFP